jgi:excisionase family DNA binding protein
MSSAVTKSPPVLLTVQEVADRLRLSERQVRRLIAFGRLPAIRLGDKGASVRVDRGELEAWLYEEPARETADPLQGTPSRARAVIPASVGAPSGAVHCAAAGGPSGGSVTPRVVPRLARSSSTLEEHRAAAAEGVP